MSIIELQRRQREIGRLRMGTKGPKGNPIKLDTWRLTSPNPELITAAAQEYGGKPKPWDNNQWEIITEQAALPVIIPPLTPGQEPASQHLELWAKGGLIRRCDGQTAWISSNGGDAVLIEQPCICAAQDKRECSPTTVARFWLPDLPGLGVWILRTTGWSAAQELPADLDLLAGRNVPNVRLVLEQRSSKKRGEQRHNYVVPVLQTPVRLRELMGGVADREGVPSALPLSADVGTVAEVVPLGQLGEVMSDGSDSNESSPASAAEPAHIGSQGDYSEIVVKAREGAKTNLTNLLAEGPPSGIKDFNEDRLRMLFGALEGAGVIENADEVLHQALSKRNARHVADLSAPQLRVMAKEAWEWAEQQVRLVEVDDE